MKKLFSILLSCAILLGLLSGCANNGYQSGDDDDGIRHENSGNKDIEGGDSNDPELPKIDGIVRWMGVPSEGKIMVWASSAESAATDTQEYWYCINTSGDILFKVKDKNYGVMTESRFVNGYVPFDDGLCDSKGNIVYPEDVGVTEFYWHAFDAGYIIAEKITETDAGEIKELGILNTQMEWVVPLSADLHAQMMYRDWMALEVIAQCMYPQYIYGSDYTYCQDGYLYISVLEKFLNLTTGELISSEAGPKNQAPETWERGYFEGKYRYEDRLGNVVLDLSNMENIYTLGYFANGKSTIVFYDEVLGEYSFAGINTKGELLFDPVTIPVQTEYLRHYADGSTIVLCGLDGSQMKKVWTYDFNGKQIAELDVSQEEYEDNHFVTLRDGIITLHWFGDDDRWFDLFTTDLKPLFK